MVHAQQQVDQTRFQISTIQNHFHLLFFVIYFVSLNPVAPKLPKQFLLPLDLEHEIDETDKNEVSLQASQLSVPAIIHTRKACNDGRAH